MLSASGGIVLITMPVTPGLRSPSGAPVPALATPTSVAIVDGAVWMIRLWST